MQKAPVPRASLRRPNRSPCTQGRTLSCKRVHRWSLWALHSPPLFFALLTALDDCIALRHVMEFLAARLGVGLVGLHRRFAVRFDEPSSIAQVLTLIDDSKTV